ncbi:MAG: hypothetical protein AB1813_13820 [Verrucomicrobiota bacterium]
MRRMFGGLIIALIVGLFFARAATALDLAQIDSLMAQVQPTAAEQRFHSIPWATDIRDALRQARETGRLVFYFQFTSRNNMGRC